MQDEFYAQLIFNARNIGTYSSLELGSFLGTICVTKYNIHIRNNISIKLYFKDKTYKLIFEPIQDTAKLNVYISVKNVFELWYLKPLNKLLRYNTTVNFSIENGTETYELFKNSIVKFLIF